MNDRPFRTERDSGDEAEVMRLLRLAGARPELPPERAARLYDKTHAAWRTQLKNRKRYRVATGLAAGLLAAAIGAVIVKLPGPPAADPALPAGRLADVVRVEGDVYILRASAHRADPIGAIAGTEVVSGDAIDTGESGRVVLEMGDGVSVRLDTGTLLRLETPAALDLRRGAVYIDTGERSTGFVVRTPQGEARDIGTQFELRVAEGSLQVRVRSGAIELHRSTESVRAASGTELVATADQTMSRAVPVSGPDWEWASALAPDFRIDGQPLSAFLQYLSREHGWTIRYGDPGLARATSGIILSGSVEGLPPEEALAIALRTSGLEHRREAGAVVVFRPAR